MNRQDRDLLVAAAIGGAGMFLAVTGLGWAVVQLVNLFARKDNT